jgi:hypothetical protein
MATGGAVLPGSTKGFHTMATIPATVSSTSTKAPKAATKVATAKAPKVATAKAPKVATAKAPKAAAGTATPPAGGYLVLVSTCPARPDSNRAMRWPLLVQHAGKPNGIAALHKALKAANEWASAKGMLGWCAGTGYVVADGIAGKAPKAAPKA